MSRPRSSSALASPTARPASGTVETRWFGPVLTGSSNQNRDRPVSTRPLSAIVVGRTTSNALIRSDATSRSRPSSSRYRSRTLPERTYASASGDIAGLLGSYALAGGQALGETVQPRHDLWHVPEERRIVEARIQASQRQPLRRHRVDREEVAQGRPLVGRAQRRTLDDRVGLLATEATLVDQRHEHARGRVQPEPAFDVLAHPLRADEQTLDQGRHPDEHVVEDDRRVGQDHALGARMADVALVPERLVLEPGLGIATEEPGEPRDPLGQD